MSNKDINYLHVYQFEGKNRKAWQDSLIHKDFCDITLYCDNKQIEAHKIIISSYSKVFLNILRQSSNSHQIIYMSGVKYTELQNLIMLMYEGEVSINKDDIDNFLNVAEDLKISGLSKGHKYDKSLENCFSQIELIPKKVYGQPNMIEMDEINGRYFTENVDVEDLKHDILEKSTTYTEMMHLYDDNLSKSNQFQEKKLY